MYSFQKIANLRPFASCFNRNVAYKSAISLETLYPNSSLKLTTPAQPHCSLSEKFSGFIPLDQVDIKYDKSSGPGGQNVNKVNTKVTLRFHVETAEWLDPTIRTKLAQNYKNRLSKEGYIMFRSELTRSQQLNLADCLEKVRKSIVKAAYEPPPVSEECVERARQRKAQAAFARLAVKRRRSDLKESRQEPSVRDV